MTSRDLLTLLAAASAVAVAPAVLAQDAQAKAAVDAAKTSGAVGEQADGYLGVRGTVSPDIQDAVNQINAGRARLYRETAARNGVTPEAAGASSYQLRFQSFPAGQWYRGPDGVWKRK